MGQVQTDIGFKVTIIDANIGDGHIDSPSYGCNYLTCQLEPKEDGVSELDSRFYNMHNNVIVCEF